MASNDLDDLMPRPLPKPSQLEEVCTRPEVPEVSLVFDSLPANSAKCNQSPVNQNASIQQQMNALSLSKNHFLNHPDPRYSLPSYSIPVSHSPLANGFSRTPINVDDHGFHAPKKVSFSPHASKNDNSCQQNVVETLHNESENTNCHCNHDTATVSKFNVSRSTPDGKKSCSCASCAIDSSDYPPEHINSGYIRSLKNLERKINAKVSFDDLQKTELKIENVLLKHKCKYDKLGENCVTREEFNKVVQKYESQINVLQLRLEELTQKIAYLPPNAVACGRENTKCACSNLPNTCQKNPPLPVNTNAVKCSNHNCCAPHTIPNSNGKYFQEMYRKFENEEALIPRTDCLLHKQTQVSMQVAASDQQEGKQKIRQEICCRSRETSKSPVHCELQHEELAENRGQPAINFRQSPNQCSNKPPHVPRSNGNERSPEHRPPSRNFSHEHQQPQPQFQSQEIGNDKQVLKASEKNIRLDWTFYNNIVEDVKNLMQQNTAVVDRNGDTAELIKKATMEQLQKMGINIDGNSKDERHARDDQCPKSNFIPGNSVPSPDMGFRLNSLAMKYVTDVPPSGDYYSKKSPNDMSFRSNCNNVSIATLQYMERYQLLPNTDQRYGGNPGDFNKYEQNISQEHRHKLYKQTQNNDRSFIY